MAQDETSRAAAVAKLEAEAAKLRAEERKLLAEALEKEADAERARIDLEIKRRARQEELTANKYHHLYSFTESVNATSVKACMEQLTKWMRMASASEKQPIEIVFSSPGGSVIDGLALFDFIQQVRRAGHFVTTSTIGYAASMAGILLQAGDHRAMGAEAYILVHEVSFGAGGKIGEVEDEVKFIKKIQDRVLSIFAQRTKLSKQQLASRWNRKDWWLDSAEALKLGFVDEVR